MGTITGLIIVKTSDGLLSNLHSAFIEYRKELCRGLDVIGSHKRIRSGTVRRRGSLEEVCHGRDGL